MPGRNIIKNYQKNSYYHIYNRGVNKNSIFLGEKDYVKFKYYLEVAASRYEVGVKKYELEHNHFHLCIHQKNERGIEKLMRSTATSYALYFNFKYERVGSLFQGNYRARRLESQEELEILINYMNRHRGDSWEDLGWTLI